MTKIGVFIRKCESIFTNGCFQQAYFTLKALKNAGFETEFITSENYPVFEIINSPVRVIDANSDISDLDIALFTSAVIRDDNFLLKLKKNNVKIINQLGGNHFILMQEDIIFNQHNIIDNIFLNYADEIWLLPMYSFAKSFLETLTKIHITVVPYVWDTDIIDEYMKQTNLDFNFKPINNLTNVNCLIAEPNLSIHKNCMVPLTICEHLFMKAPNSINKVYTLCKRDNTNFNHFIQKLTLNDNNKIELHSRMILPIVLNELKKQNKMTITISHQILNDLNFIHLELLYLGYPLVHNCTPFKNTGYFYSEHDINDGYNAISNAILHHNENLTQYKENAKKYIWKYSSSNPDNYNIYKHIVNNYFI